jgi:hypothetical protein
MHSIVKRLREKGVPRSRDDIALDHGYEGELRYGVVGTVATATLTEPEDEHMRPLIPSLEHAELVVMRVDMMMFRGIERDKSGAGYEQEWSVRIIGY